MGFWASKTTDGFSTGPFIPKGEEPYYLTFFKKEGIVNAHLTIGRKPNVNYIDLVSLTPDEFDRKLQSIYSSLENSITVPNIEPNTKLFYVGHRLLDSLPNLSGITTTQRKRKEEFQDIQLENLVKIIPSVVYQIRNHPKEFFGFAKAKDIIRKPYIAGGFTNEGQFIFFDQDQPFQMKMQPHSKMLMEDGFTQYLGLLKPQKKTMNFSLFLGLEIFQVFGDRT